jgi:hypothetical protein
MSFGVSGPMKKITNFLPKALGVAILCLLFSVMSKGVPVAMGDTLGTPATPQAWWSEEELKQKLGSTGVEGELHAVHAETETYVFTLRNPNNFFEFVHFSLVPWTQRLGRQLANLKRHDRVRIFGEVMRNRSPQIHIQLVNLEIIQLYQPERTFPPYEREVTLPRDLPRNAAGNGEALFLVHAVHAEGQILVVEFKDAVIPIFVREPKISKELYRNDIVRIFYRLQSSPTDPTHLRLRNDVAEPIVRVESARAKHGLPADLTGALVLFPKSPQVSVDVFALHEEVEGGATRQYTLANFESPEVFQAIREKCLQAWQRDPENYVNGRNKLLHNKIRVRARGIYNVVDPNQANIQILLKSADDLEILE